MKTKLFFALILVAFLVAPLWAKGPNGPSTSSGLTDIEKASILYLFEEEKLARDIYEEMHELYGAYIFDKIRESEQRHMDSVEKLITKYVLDDEGVLDLKEISGSFVNEDIQALYSELYTKRTLSLTSALEVGVEIEKTDIGDIQSMLPPETDKADIIRVLNNLLEGSYNHLDAFESQFN